MERNSKNQLDKHSFPYYDTHNKTRKTVEKEEYIFNRVFTESCRRWDCSMALEMEWTFEGSPEFEYGLTATAVVKRAAYMLVYEKSGPKGQVEWHRGYEIRLKHQILNRYLILGIFFIPKGPADGSSLQMYGSKNTCSVQDIPHHGTFAPHLQQLLAA